MIFAWPNSRPAWVLVAMLCTFMLTGCQSTKEIVVEKVVQRKIEIPNSL